MSLEAELSYPVLGPSEETLRAFWKRITQVSTRSRDAFGAWVGSTEVKLWNAANPHVYISNLFTERYTLNN
jgi:hypothetical protein